MPQITLKKAQVQQLVAFCDEHKQANFFMAKDQGAYVGAAAGIVDGQMKNCIFYFKGCDPQKDQDWYHNARDMFGGDDFGENFPVSHLKDALAQPDLTSVVIKVTPTSVSIQAKMTAKKH